MRIVLVFVYIAIVWAVLEYQDLKSAILVIGIAMAWGFYAVDERAREMKERIDYLTRRSPPEH